MNALQTYFIISMIHIPIVHIFLVIITDEFLPRNWLDYVAIILLSFMFSLFWISIFVYLFSK